MIILLFKYTVQAFGVSKIIGTLYNTRR